MSGLGINVETKMNGSQEKVVIWIEIQHCVCTPVYLPSRYWQKPLNRSTHMTQKYSLPLSGSVCLPSSIPLCLSPSLMGALYVAYLHPNNLLRGIMAHTHAHPHMKSTHATQRSRHAADWHQLSNWLTRAYYSLKRQIGYRAHPWTGAPLIRSPKCATLPSTADKPCNADDIENRSTYHPSHMG